MQTDESVPEGTEAEAGPTEATETEATPQQPEAPTEPETPVEYLEINDDNANKYVRVKVDGEDVEVPLSEALQGYSRTADYTRKTQEIAKQRQEAQEAIQVMQALRAAPGLTVQILAQQEGMSVEQFLNLPAAQQQRAVEEATEEEQYQDPLERQLAEQSRQIQALSQAQAQRQAEDELRSVVQGLKTQFQAGDDDIRAAVQTAMQMNMPPSALPMIYQSIAFQKMNTQQQTRQEADQQRQVQASGRQAAAQAAGQVVSAGTGATGTTSSPASDGRMSLSDAIASAVEGLPD